MEVSEVDNVLAVNISEKHERRGATKHCAYGLCKSDSRYMDRLGMEGVFFIRFPQFHREPEKCTRWASACRREHFTALSVKKDTYICSLHFKGGRGPTEEYPDPIPATATKHELEKFVRNKKKRPLVRKNLTWSPEPKRKKSDLVNIDIVETKATSAPSDEDHCTTNHDTVQAAEALLMLQNSESEQVS
ncbi:uncharacterized protein LOC133199999 [Saccostrea echinata]|uniref:uncharacterized protein LOC133199999 n=1 Tax=Saccostrea echinata TaxID=191078 RepID=UPI002A834F5B|nr:uncharacterized protein LOC133199999 [Saccostrea echinata]